MKTKWLKYTLLLGLTTLATTPYADNIAQGKMKAATCVGCHGDQGIGLSQNYPNLAGQKSAYLIKQLQDFKTGNRNNPTMQAMASTLSNQDIADISAYYASLTSTPKINLTTTIKSTDKATINEFPKPIFVTMKKSGTLEIFPQQKTWKGGPNMLYNAITPNGKLLLATSPSSDAVYIFNAKTHQRLAIIKVGKAPKGVKVTPNGKFAYVSNQGSANISVINLKTLAVIDTIAVKKEPHNVRFTQNGHLAYVTLQGGAGLGVINTQTRKLIKVIPIPGITGPHNLDLSLDEKTAFVRDFVHHIAVVDLQTNQVKKVILVGNGHGGIDVTPDDKYVATAAIGDKFISIINTKTFKVTKIMMGTASHGIRASQNSQWLYITLPKVNALAVVNLKTLKLIKKIPVGKFPFWIAVKGNS